MLSVSPFSRSALGTATERLGPGVPLPVLDRIDRAGHGRALALIRRPWIRVSIGFAYSAAVDPRCNRLWIGTFGFGPIRLIRRPWIAGTIGTCLLLGRGSALQ